MRVLAKVIMIAHNLFSHSSESLHPKVCVVIVVVRMTMTRSEINRSLRNRWNGSTDKSMTIITAILTMLQELARTIIDVGMWVKTIKPHLVKWGRRVAE